MTKKNPSDDTDKPDKPTLFERLRNISTPGLLVITGLGIGCLIGAYLLLR